MNQYQYEQVYRKMQQRYGKMKKGKEGEYFQVMFPMESNLLKIKYKNPKINSYRVQEAITLVLHTVESYLTGEEKELKAFENEDNLMLKEALLFAFDPKSNEEIREILSTEGGFDLDDKDFLEGYYKNPVICLLRIRESVDLWTKEMGNDGYFQFVEGQIGEVVPHDDKMNFSVLIERKRQ